MATLYEINKELLALEELSEELDEQTLADTWEALAVERKDKIEAVLSYIKHLRFMAEGIKAEAKTLADRSKSYEKRAESLLGYLQGQMDEREQYESSRHKITWRASQSVQVSVEAESLPEAYQRTKVTVEPNKKLLLDDLKAGAEVEGVTLVSKLNMGVK
jgi:hypothetical protein